MTREVSLAGVTISVQHCEALGSTLCFLDGINKLDLSNCLLPTSGLNVLFSKLSYCNLIHLNLKGNNICGISTKNLSRLISKNKSIKVSVFLLL